MYIIRKVHNDGIDSSSSTSGTRMIKIKCNEVTSVKHRPDQTSENERKKHPSGCVVSPTMFVVHPTLSGLNDAIGSVATYPPTVSTYHGYLNDTNGREKKTQRENPLSLSRPKTILDTEAYRPELPGR